MHATTITTLLLALEALAVPLRSEHALVSNGTVHRAGDGPQPNLIFMLMVRALATCTAVLLLLLPQA